MRISLIRRRAVIAAGLSALALGAALPALAAPAAATPRTHAPRGVTRSAVQPRDMVVNCTGRARVKPRGLVLACADGNDYLTGLRWASWAGGVAFGRGTEHVNTCVPDCASGRFRAYRVLLTLWRPVPRLHHPGQARFSRLTGIYPGRRPAWYRADGTKYFPQTVTWDLSRR